MGAPEPDPPFDVAVVGFGLAGLAVLARLVGGATGPRRIAVVADDLSGHGLAYGTQDPGHLLNVPAERMSALADDDFADWLRTGDAAARTDALGAPTPGPEDYAPRTLYAAYLDDVRTRTASRARATGIEIAWITGEATRLSPAPGGWALAVAAGPTVPPLRARAVVLATGNEPKAVFGELEHPRLVRGPWNLPEDDVPSWTGPVVLVGTSLTAVDAVLTLRRLGLPGEIVAVSRNGLVPEPHVLDRRPAEVDEDAVDAVATLDDLRALVVGLREDGHELPSVIDGLRPYVQDVWQRLPAADQRRALEHVATWGTNRHRMAPPVGAVVAEERRSGGLRVHATRSLTPSADGDDLVLDVVHADGTEERLRPSAIVDCAGFQLDWSASARPLLRGLVEDGVCTPHPTGLGVVADDLEVAPGVYATGSVLTGQLWESVAVPEIREQAARIAERIAGRGPDGR